MSDLHQPTAFDGLLDDFIWSLAPPQAEHAPDESDKGNLPAVLTDDDLDRVLLDYFGVSLPNTRCCEGHSTPWDAFHDAFFARSAISVWKASRGFGGKSFTLAALGLVEGLFLRADVNILGGSGVQSKRVLEAMAKLWAHPNAPRDKLKGSEPGSESQRLIWGNNVLALMASTKSVRGPHPQRLRMDEVDEIKLSILDPALGQPMSKGWILSQVVLSSTHQYPDGTMTEMLRRAGANGWKVFEWCYRETLEPHGWCSVAEVERKRGILTASMWETEIELQEPSSEGRAIVTEKVKDGFRETLVLEPPAPCECGHDEATHLHATVRAACSADGCGCATFATTGKYGTGGDWAKKRNWTVIATIRKDVRPRRVVALTRIQRKPWPTMVQAYDDQVRRYGGTACHDNTGLGTVISDLLGVAAEDFDMVGRARKDLLTDYINAIEKGDLLWPKDETNVALAAAYAEHLYATIEDVYKGTKDGTGKHHLPDTISSGALAWRAADQADAVGEMTPPEDKGPLHGGFQRGRLSGQVFGNRRR